MEGGRTERKRRDRKKENGDGMERDGMDREEGAEGVKLRWLFFFSFFSRLWVARALWLLETKV